MTIPLSLVTLAALFGLAADRKSYALVPALALWLAAALASLLAQHAISACYLTPALAPLLLLTGVGLERLSGSATARSRIAALVGFGAVVIVAVALLRGRSLVAIALVPDDTALRGATAAIEATSPRAGDTLFVVSRGGLLYSATGLDPPMPYFEWSQTLCNFPEAGRSTLAGVLASAPRFIVVADRAKAYRCEQGSHWALIDEALQGSYRRVAEAEGPREMFQIYERR
jgi:hypothetical protein